MRNTFFHEQSQFTRSFRKRLNEKLAEVGLFHSQWLVLYCIFRQQTISLVEISNYLNVEKPTVSRTVKRLEEQAFVEAVPSEDKRERRVRLTTKGEAYYHKAYAIVMQFEESLMEDISENDLEIAMTTIQKLKEKLN